ncbi:MAG TPA: hypothetical protein VMA71_09475 [Alloacidobacterium sp.]|nr:hypothetical protein [Alloacidobacterium sp.]
MSGRPLTRCFVSFVLALTALAFSTRSSAQQKDIQRFDLYSGFAYFTTPDLNLDEHGFHIQAGYNATRMMAVGFDYSNVSGHNSLTPSLLTMSEQLQVQTALNDLALEGLLPPGYQLSVPTGASTQTFAAGPELTIRHYVPVTIFVRPDLGAIREVARTHPTDPIAALIVQGLAPSGTKTSWASFYGFGGGMDWNASRNLGLRVQVDEVNNHLFNDLLKNARWTTRVSIGPTFRFGGNIPAKK